MKKRLETLFAEYGAIAITIYFTIFAITLGSFAFALNAGLEVEGVAGSTGTLAAAWVATKLTQPLRIIATIVLTPLVAALLHRLRGTTPQTALATETATDVTDVTDATDATDVTDATTEADAAPSPSSLAVDETREVVSPPRRRPGDNAMRT